MYKIKLLTVITILSGTILFVSGFLFISDKFPDSGDNAIHGESVKTLPEVLSAAESTECDFPFNVLLLGGDWINDNSDTIMLINYNPAGNSVNLMSIPRDTQVTIEGRTRKLNFAYPRGGKELAVKTVEALTGAKIKYFALIDTAAFRKIVDVFGEVYFFVPQNMKYSDPTQNLYINLKKGWQYLDGNKAEQLVRYRAGYEDGDLTRIRVQQDFVKEFIRQKVSFKNIHKLAAGVEIMFDSIETDIPQDKALELLTRAVEIKGENIAAFTLPGTKWPGKSIWYYKINKQETSEIIKNYFKSE